MTATFTANSRLIVSPDNIPTRTPNETIVGKGGCDEELWAPAVNNHGGLGRWPFLEIRDIYDAEKAIRDCPAEFSPRRVA